MHTCVRARVWLPYGYYNPRGGVSREGEKPLIFSRTAESRRVADFDGTIGLWIMISARQASSSWTLPTKRREREVGERGRIHLVPVSTRGSRPVLATFFFFFFRFYSVATEERQFQSCPEGAWKPDAGMAGTIPAGRGKYSKYEKSAENERWATERMIGAGDRCRRERVFSRAIVFSFRARWSSGAGGGRRRSRCFVLVECRGKYWCDAYSIIRTSVPPIATVVRVEGAHDSVS